MLEILGAIFLIVIGKFIYDTYFSDNTEKNWDKYKNENPEKAARIDGNSGLNFSTSPIRTQSYKNISELNRLLIRLSLELYKKVEPRQKVFNSSYEGNRNIEQYFKSVCSILGASVIEAALDLDNVGKNEDIRKQLKMNLRDSYLRFASQLVKTNKIIFPFNHLPTNNDNALALHAIVKMEQYGSSIKFFLSTGKFSYSETREDYDDDGDSYEYQSENQFGFIQDIYEVGFDEVGSSTKVNFKELEYEIEECKTEIASLLNFIRTYVVELRAS